MTSAARKHAARILRPLFAIGMLALVATFVPWNDRLVWRTASHGMGAAGNIVGDWRAEEIRFRLAPDVKLEAGWPEDLARELSAGAAVVVRRSPADAPSTSSGRLDWRPGMLRVFRELEPGGLWMGMAMLLVAALVSVTRWWRLLQVAGCPATWRTALRLTFLGFFFNLIVPGLTGGDVVKAVLVVRENPARRADALISVIVDRGLGLLVLMALATIVVYVSGSHFAELRLPVLLTFLACAAILWVLLHPGSRRFLKLSALLEHLPQRERLRSLDRALRIYGEHPWEMAIAAALSVANHLTLVAGIFAVGRAFGDQLGYLEYLGVAAIANTLSSVPIAPAGWGVGEAAFGSLFHLLGAAGTLGVAVSITYRLMTMALGLAGGLFLLLPGGRDVRREIEAEGRREDAVAPTPNEPPATS